MATTSGRLRGMLSEAGAALAGLRAPLPRREAPELLDLPDQDPAELAANLRDIRRVNRLGGGTAAVLRELPALLAPVPPDRPALILDLATGSADIPLAIARWARRRGRPVRIIAADVSLPILAEARRLLADEPDVALLAGDARAVPLADGAVDIALCSLALHHFAPADAVRVLRELERVARYGWLVNDLTRSRRGYVGAWLAAHLATRNRLTRHDAPLSVLRAYTPDEIRGLLAQAGIDGAVVRTRPLFRMVVRKLSVER